jgi:hypothetical protein
MERTWASGALELLRHADSHLKLNSAFDKRIAFVSVDNAVETCVRTFLSLPSSKSGVKVSRSDVETAANSFPKLVELLFTVAGNRLRGLDPSDIEHYHRIRNTLYHEGTGLSVDEQYLAAYRTIAAVLLKSLFDVIVQKLPGIDVLPMEMLVLNWNRIEEVLKEKMVESGSEDYGTFKWEAALKAGILTIEDIQSLTELRMARNKIVHSAKGVDSKNIIYWLKKSEQLLRRLGVEVADP